VDPAGLEGQGAALAEAKADHLPIKTRRAVDPAVPLPEDLVTKVDLLRTEYRAVAREAGQAVADLVAGPAKEGLAAPVATT
jgi:hypothetical protein